MFELQLYLSRSEPELKSVTVGLGDDEAGCHRLHLTRPAFVTCPRRPLQTVAATRCAFRWSLAEALSQEGQRALLRYNYMRIVHVLLRLLPRFSFLALHAVFSSQSDTITFRFGITDHRAVIRILTNCSLYRCIRHIFLLSFPQLFQLFRRDFSSLRFREV